MLSATARRRKKVQAKIVCADKKNNSMWRIKRMFLWMFKNRQSIKLEAEGELNWVKTFIELGYVVTIGDSSLDSLLLKSELRCVFMT